MIKRIWKKLIATDKNTIIKNSFLLPILAVVIMSISHVISWYDLGNPIAWAIYLSVAVEIFALASVSAASIRIKRGSIWILFGVVTFIQVMGNVFFTYKDIDPTGEGFMAWMELLSPWTEDWNILDHKRFLAYIQGGTLPLMSLIALHFYIKFSDNLHEIKSNDPDYFEKRNTHIEKLVEERETEEIEVSPEIEDVIKTENNLDDQGEDIIPDDEEADEMIPDSSVKRVLKEEQKKEDQTKEKLKTEDIVQKVTPKPNPQDVVNDGQVKGHRKNQNPGQHPQIMPGTN